MLARSGSAQRAPGTVRDGDGQATLGRAGRAVNDGSGRGATAGVGDGGRARWPRRSARDELPGRGLQQRDAPLAPAQGRRHRTRATVCHTPSRGAAPAGQGPNAAGGPMARRPARVQRTRFHGPRRQRAVEGRCSGRIRRPMGPGPERWVRAQERGRPRRGARKVAEGEEGPSSGCDWTASTPSRAPCMFTLPLQARFAHRCACLKYHRSRAYRHGAEMLPAPYLARVQLCAAVLLCLRRTVP